MDLQLGEIAAACSAIIEHIDCSVVAIQPRRSRRGAATFELADGRRLFAKRHGDQRFGSSSEVDANQYLKTLPSSSGLAPKFFGHDEATGLLLFEEVSSTTLADVGLDGLSSTSTRRFARALACLHQSSAESGSLDRLRVLPAPIESLRTLSPRQLTEGPGLEYVQFVSALQGIDDAIRTIDDQWTTKSMIHADLRDDNLVLTSSASSSASSIQVVDWELSGRGDPYFDVGSFLGQLVFSWLSIAASSGPDASDDALADARRHGAAFVEDYRDELGEQVDGDLDSSVVRYAGAFLVNRSLAFLEVFGALGALGAASLRFGCDLVRLDPGLVGGLWPMLMP